MRSVAGFLAPLGISDAAGDPGTRIQDRLRGFALGRFRLRKATTTAAQLLSACDEARAEPWDRDGTSEQRARPGRAADIFLQRPEDCERRLKNAARGGRKVQR